MDAKAAATSAVRHDDSTKPSNFILSKGFGLSERERPACKYRAALDTAKTHDRNNDTSVIRGPIIKKMGRLNAYGAGSLLAA
jgi:hypothetical protein